ncbi:MAG: hypothetical protein AAB305_05860 [Candidatus Zixiibacteriota bacterium]
MTLDQRIRFRDKDLSHYSTQEVETFLRSHLTTFTDNLDKLTVELLVGTILARSGEQFLNVIHGVAFMLADDHTSTIPYTKPSLSEIVSRTVRIHEHEVDVYVVRDKMKGEKLPDRLTFCMSPIQVTHLPPPRDNAQVDTPALCRLLMKKCRVQPDDYLQLAILIDATFDLDQQLFLKELSDESIPYKQIYLISQAGNPPILGRFLIQEVYPKRDRYSEVQLNLGASS